MPLERICPFRARTSGHAATWAQVASAEEAAPASLEVSLRVGKDNDSVHIFPQLGFRLLKSLLWGSEKPLADSFFFVANFWVSFPGSLVGHLFAGRSALVSQPNVMPPLALGCNTSGAAPKGGQFYFIFASGFFHAANEPFRP